MSERADVAVLQLIAGDGLLVRRSNEIVFCPVADTSIAEAFATSQPGEAVEAVASLVDADPGSVADFVVVQWGERLRLAVHGAVEVTSDHRSLPRLSASGAGTWVERSLPVDRSIVLRCGAGAVLATTSLVEGAVAAGGFELHVDPSAVPTPARETTRETTREPGTSAPSGIVESLRSTAFGALSESDADTVEPAPEPEAESPADERPEPTEQPVVDESARLAACPSCLSPVRVGADVCPTCGHQLGTAAPSVITWQIVFADGRVESVDRTLVLGREPHPDDDSARPVVLDCDLVSATHLEVRQSGSGLLLTDLGSRNSTFVLTTGDAQFVPIEARRSHRVGDGTVVQLGRQRFTVRLVTGDDGVATSDV